MTTGIYGLARPVARPVARPLAGFVARGLVLGLVTLMAACGGGSSQSGPAAPADLDARRAAFPLNDDDFAKLGYRRDWVGYPAVGTGAHLAHMYADSELVIVQDSRSIVTGLEGTTGERRWSVETGSPLTRFVGLTRQGQKALACAEAELVGLRTDTGDIVSRQSYSRVVNTAPVIVGEIAIFGTASGTVIGHGLGLGFQTWAFGTGAAVSRDPVMVGGVVGTVNDRGEVFFLNPVSGSLEGRSRAMYAGSAFNPVSTGELMVVASQDQSLYAFRPGSERPVWQFRSSQRPGAQPSFFGGAVFCEIEGSLMAFDAATGNRKWVSTGTKGTVVAIRKGRLVVKDGSTLSLLDADRGDVIERISVPGLYRVFNEGLVSPTEGNLYLVSTSGLVAKFLPR